MHDPEGLISQDPPAPGPAPEDILAELGRVLASRTFSTSARHRDILKFIVLSRLENPAVELKESALAVDVLGRDASTFDPRIDTIVRVEARRLRARLDDYYAGEGAGSCARISVPRGSYLPVFSSVEPIASVNSDQPDAQGAAESAASNIEPNVAAVEMDHAASIPAVQPRHKSERRWSPVRLSWALAILVVTAIAFSLWWPAQQPASAAASNAPASLAVLPFANLNGDPSLEPFIDGLVDEITGSLSRVPRLRVIARTSSFAYKGKSLDVRAIGRALGVTSVVEGSVQRSDGRLKVIVQLIRTDDGSHVWSDVFVTPLEEIFQLQTRVTQAVTRTFEPALQAQVLQQAGGTTNWPAWEAYSRAQFLMRDGRRDGYTAAMPLLDEAIRLDPAFGRAYGARGIARFYTNAWSGTAETASVQQSHDDLEEAIRIDPSLTHYLSTVAAWAYLQEYDWPKAKALYERALSSAPASPDARAAYAGALLLQGRAAEADAGYESSLMVDPLNIMAALHHAAVPLFSGRPEASVDRFVKLDAVNPGNALIVSYLVRARLVAGDVTGARRDTNRLDAMTSTTDRYVYEFSDALTTASEGKRQAARAAVDRLAATWGARQPYLVSDSYAWIGEAPLAVRWFLLAVKHGDTLAAYLPVDPMFDPIRQAPEFRTAWDAIPGLTSSLRFPDPRPVVYETRK